MLVFFNLSELSHGDTVVENLEDAFKMALIHGKWQIGVGIRKRSEALGYVRGIADAKATSEEGEQFDITGRKSAIPLFFEITITRRVID